MVKFAEIIVGLLVCGLFAIAFINAGIQIAEVNDVNHSIADDVSIREYASNINETLTASYDDANSSLDLVSRSPISQTSGGVFSLQAIRGIWNTLYDVPILVYQLTIGLIFQKFLGSAGFAIVTTVVGAILIIIIILTAYKMFSSGEGI